jgi:hypothetical protein
MPIRVHQHARPATRRPVRADRPPAARATDAAETPRVRRTASSAPADVAFTHDPLSGAVTRHEHGAAVPSAEHAAGSTKPIDLGAYQSPEADRPASPAAAIAPWRELEPAGTPTAAETNAIAPPVPAPTAVH